MFDFDKVVKAMGLLSPADLSRRVQQYNGDGQFERDLHAIWDVCQADIGSFILDQITRHLRGSHHGGYRKIDQDGMIDIALKMAELKFTRPVDQYWVNLVALQGSFFYDLNYDTSWIAREFYERATKLAAVVNKGFADDPSRAAYFTGVIHRLSFYELEAVMKQISILETQAARKDRNKASEAFEADIAEQLSLTLVESQALRQDCTDTSHAAQKTLDRALEVATAAEQSSVTMLDAAKTAAGLSRSIAEVESEMEYAGKVFELAVEQSSKAMTSSTQLSSEVRSIESILGFIRDIAGQTNLLSLNATIEAARAGSAGRGFAVVAQEVKSLANQTARATDDIAAKIAAIQSATAETVNANGEIQHTIGEMQTNAIRITDALHRQSQTVTVIAASVDETARMADSISGTVGAIRVDAEKMVANVERVTAGSDAVENQLKEMKRKTGEFLNDIAVR